MLSKRELYYCLVNSKFHFQTFFLDVEYRGFLLQNGLFLFMFYLILYFPGSFKGHFVGFLAIFIRGKMQSFENDPIMPIWYRQYFAISISFPSILNAYYECLIWKRNYNSSDVKYLINCQVFCKD